jgi:hypothetical protein
MDCTRIIYWFTMRVVQHEMVLLKKGTIFLVSRKEKDTNNVEVSIHPLNEPGYYIPGSIGIRYRIQVMYRIRAGMKKPIICFERKNKKERIIPLHPLKDLGTISQVQCDSWAPKILKIRALFLRK